MNFTTKSQVESPRPCRLSHEVAYSFKVCHVSRQVLGVKMVGRLFWVSPCVVAYGIYHKKIEFTKGIVPFVNFRIIWFHLPSLKLKPCTWTWMLGMRVSIWGPAYSQGLAVSFRKWCMSSLMLANFMCRFPCSLFRTHTFPRSLGPNVSSPRNAWRKNCQPQVVQKSWPSTVCLSDIRFIMIKFTTKLRFRLSDVEDR